MHIQNKKARKIFLLFVTSYSKIKIAVEALPITDIVCRDKLYTTKLLIFFKIYKNKSKN